MHRVLYSCQDTHMLFTSVPAVFSSTSSDTSRAGGNSGCFVKGEKKTKNKQQLLLIFLLVRHMPRQSPVPAGTTGWRGRRGSHLGVEGDLGEEEPRVDAHQLPVSVVQMTLPETQGETWRIQSDVTRSSRACVYWSICTSLTAFTLLPFTMCKTITQQGQR